MLQNLLVQTPKVFPFTWDINHSLPVQRLRISTTSGPNPLIFEGIMLPHRTTPRLHETLSVWGLLDLTARPSLFPSQVGLAGLLVFLPTSPPSLRTRFNFWIIEFGNLTRCTLNWLHGLIQWFVTCNLWYIQSESTWFQLFFAVTLFKAAATTGRYLRDEPRLDDAAESWMHARIRAAWYSELVKRQLLSTSQSDRYQQLAEIAG
ncbi:hypothetical protein C8R44DRAFT_752365 [Mycena epipterygia]|nr:hypothetical protein C8R44DRAFT_752365 [Mycena epipterygia]